MGTITAVNESTFGFVLSILCVGAVLAVVIVLIRLRLRVGQLHGLPSVRRGGAADADAHPREFDDASDDGGDDDGGDGGDA